MANYSELAELREIYLEDSWVLNVVARPGEFRVVAEYVLRASHHLYRPPRRGEQYCYRLGQMTFGAVTDLSWTSQGAPPAKDASGSLDYGNIDYMEIPEPGHYRLGGDFGVIDIRAISEPVLSWVPDDETGSHNE